MKTRSGLKILEDDPGNGRPVERNQRYRVRLRMWLNKGEEVRWSSAGDPTGRSVLEDDGATLVAEIRIHRESLISGLLYGCEGMRVGGTRKLKISPHLGYGARGVPGMIPTNAVLIAEIHFVECLEVQL